VVFSFNENIWKELTSLSLELFCVLPTGNPLSYRQVFLSTPYATTGNSITILHKLKNLEIQFLPSSESTALRRLYSWYAGQSGSVV